MQKQKNIFNLEQPTSYLESQLSKLVNQSLTMLELQSADDLEFEIPANLDFGDYSTNIAMKFFSQLSADEKQRLQVSNPRDLAEKIIAQININKEQLDKVTVAGPGFINFYVAEEFYQQQFKKQLLTDNNQLVQNRQVMVEFAHPNTHKVFHIGHLRNIVTGESLVRLLQYIGFEVIRANYQGDVGLHIAKCLYGILHQDDYEQQMANLQTVEERAKFIGDAYVAGSSAYKDIPEAKKEIHDLNYLVYAAAEKFRQTQSEVDYMSFVKEMENKFDLVYGLWLKTRQWSLDLFEKIYTRLGTHYDRLYFESECLDSVNYVNQALEKEILEKSDGAIVFKGDDYGLDTRVFVNSLGLPTYEGKELSLAHRQLAENPELEKIIHVVAPEQTSFFEVCFKVEELMSDKFKGKQYHKKYGYVHLKSGKMSSRTGNIITGQWLLDEAKNKIIATYPELSTESAEKIAIAAVKYSFLKVNTIQDISFDFNESISIDGNSGPYLQYTYARCKSVLRKSDLTDQNNFQASNLTKQEIQLHKTLSQFNIEASRSALELSPHYLCTYLFKLAQDFNSFYNHCPILKAQTDEQKQLRVLLTTQTAATIKKGLNLLGIEVLEKM